MDLRVFMMGVQSIWKFERFEPAVTESAVDYGIICRQDDLKGDLFVKKS
jgi:hypothetical protein